MNKTIVLNKIRCNKCKSEPESKHRHDMVYCECGSCAVDGGHDYLRRLGNDYTDLSIVKEI